MMIATFRFFYCWILLAAIIITSKSFTPSTLNGLKLLSQRTLLNNCFEQVEPKSLPKQCRNNLKPNSHEMSLSATSLGMVNVGSNALTLTNPSLVGNHWFIWTILLWSSSFGLWSEQTNWGAALSSPLVTMLITITLCNIGIIPTSSPVYNTVNKMLVPLAVPLLLFDADIKRVVKYSGMLMLCFLLGSIGTILGTIIAAQLVPLGMGSDGWKIAAALASRHIGGAVNYVAVAETLNMSAEAVVAGLAADNLVVAVYFSFLFIMAKEDKSKLENVSEKKNSVQEELQTQEIIKLGKDGVAYAIAVGCALTFFGNVLAEGLFRGKMSGIPITTLLTVIAATLMPKVFTPLGMAGSQVGILFMQLFFAVTGASGSLSVVLSTAPSLLVFSLIQIAVHFVFTVSIGRLLKLPFNQLLLASNANVGGPTTAAAFAASKKWSTLVLPALLTGILGYAAGTFIGVGLGQGLLCKMLGY